VPGQGQPELAVLLPSEQNPDGGASDASDEDEEGGPGAVASAGAGSGAGAPAVGNTKTSSFDSTRRAAFGFRRDEDIDGTDADRRRHDS